MQTVWTELNGDGVQVGIGVGEGDVENTAVFRKPPICPATIVAHAHWGSGGNEAERELGIGDSSIANPQSLIPRLGSRRFSRDFNRAILLTARH